jgi:hypothetical protein
VIEAPAPPSPRRRLLAALTLVIAAAGCLGLAISYLAWRVSGYRRLDLVLEGDFPIEKDAEMGFVPVRNGASLRRHPRAGLAYHVFTSDRRARVARRGERTPPRVDLLALGCSFTWGHGVESDEAYPTILARRLGVPAANLAFSAYGTVQSLQTLRRSLDLRPRVVVYGFMADHMKRNLSPCAPAYGPLCLPISYVDFARDGAPEIRSPDGSLFDLNRRFWETFFLRENAWPRQLLIAGEADLARVARTPKAPPDTPTTRERSLEMLLGKMHEASTSAGARLLVVHIPYFERGTTNDVPAPLRAALSHVPGPAFLDLTPAVRRYYEDPARPLLRFDRDRHPNGRAHELIASEIERFIRERGFLASGAEGP